MSQKKTDFGFSTFTAKQLDNIMLEKNGVLGIADENNAPHSDPDVIRHGWRTQVVGRTEDPTTGRLILIPTNGQTAKIWRNGKAKWFEALGISKTHAMAIISDQETPYRFEEGVAKAVVELVESGFNKGNLLTIYLAGKAWKARTGLRMSFPHYDSLSRRRQESVITLACLVAPEGRATVKLSA